MYPEDITCFCVSLEVAMATIYILQHNIRGYYTYANFLESDRTGYLSTVLYMDIALMCTPIFMEILLPVTVIYIVIKGMLFCIL